MAGNANKGVDAYGTLRKLEKEKENGNAKSVGFLRYLCKIFRSVCYFILFFIRKGIIRTK